ncbi:MAG: DUF3365 domain-containing protein [Planctomycetota bacterium]|nr:MAG: DUF3365 domain-containing protein [Planctomycetota bacterium]
MTMKKWTGCACVLSALTVLAAWNLNGPAAAGKEGSKPADDPAIERTRDTVRMLDDIYKTAVVLITDKYVHEETDFAAGSAAVALFDAIKKKGWHEVRLLDATGEPYDDENTPRDDFDRAAVKALKAGKTWFERVERRKDGRFLRVATPIPVVMKKCVMCHPHYAQAKPGEPIGLLSYTVPVR